jgi:hypothetical protein
MFLKSFSLSARSADFGNLFNLRAECYGPFFDVPVVLVEDEHRSERRLREVERHPMWIKCVDAVYFLEGLNSS